MSFELRTYSFIDSMQPQLAQYIAKDNKVFDPSEYDAALFLEIHPAMQIHRMIDLALKATEVRLGVVILPELRWQRARELWRHAEKLGFDHAWTYDHLAWRSLRDSPWFAAVPTLAAAAAHTETIRLGTLVATPNFRHPVPFAKELVALDDLCGGRFTAGLGAGGGGWDARMLGHAVTRSVVLILLSVFLMSQSRGYTNWTFMNVLAQMGLAYTFLFLLWGRSVRTQTIAAALILPYSAPAPVRRRWALPGSCPATARMLGGWRPVCSTRISISKRRVRRIYLPLTLPLVRKRVSRPRQILPV